MDLDPLISFKVFIKFVEDVVGRWWSKDTEIDIVGIDSTSRRALFGEVKWQDLDYGEIKTIFADLMRKSKLVETDCDQDEFIVICRSVQQKKKIHDDGYQVYDLDDIVPIR
ncbi:MAG TPA: DUF234 domain-containing protein [Candidatus Lokiarchaeia archaeon]|nr:DUF234 domain-containing protein [Candidatus Lokiarchaeia archaeon]